ncbi:WD40-repeat-containing domain protein [Radiomyces spectabilis]|uniref:WD40-repeat-containing domain protein n=1 Tax=Radiomyces spectabilis TaxID=64574 RepID=UPI00222084E1|nr:WD40-repeat-containing domain protein [Radiomyces spectabilis]KAI8393398.1 WD40-repeat-containing domain protein [Radiomyces spectabilis]
MSDSYRRRLRSARHNATSQVQREIKPEEEEQEEQDDEAVNPAETVDPAAERALPNPRSPPIPVSDQDSFNYESPLEPIFPPSPYRKRRYQTQGDRLIPVRERNLTREFQMTEGYSPSGPRRSNTESDQHSQQDLETRRMSAYFLGEVCGDPTAADDFIYPDSGSRTPRRVLQFSTQRTASTADYASVFDDSPRIVSSLSPRQPASPVSDVGRRVMAAHQQRARHISQSAIKILDAPELQDDFYLNLVDWGSNDTLAVGLGSCVYLWNANTSRVTKLCDFVTDTVTSVNWAQHGTHLAVASNKGKVLLWDVETSRRVRTWASHTSRVGSLAWSSNILTSGGRDHKIFHRDVRSPEPHFRELTGHLQEVCGLKWSADGMMLASGGNDNNLLVWESHQNIIMHRFKKHCAAVKAIDWSPHARGMLVSGGGTADKTIKFWNAISGSLLSSHDTGSQVCNVAWSKKTNEIVSTHGYASNSVSSSNQVIVWKANKMQRVATLTGHSSRVLYMSMSHDGSTIVTGAGDETLRFWDVFSTVEVVRRDPEDRQSRLR